ncbi:hypothetical protein CONCODRAFT_4534 [Conidiobolus coronatus NRRL 28638]|uniref:Uncharacterized protein n=1 Tax=Conidiobolus coronatus (strain ATCC 28846 / CBS 209.66 / NRRL 28638) TaxID=796925 RepID=A0A137PCJ9_CONC2|nr:hypothetical protein CONCODRAFT_4534 [Conidiobolus coronatus NRRL 28638]|eukprot:KXN72671.1 hypothetical protein CONCODRAFT_4534 [Conidiobolus coronatus NRRL 28638]
MSGSNFTYSEENSKLCCNKMTGSVSFISDGFCTGQEDFLNGPVFEIYAKYCESFSVFTGAHAINCVTPSKIITVRRRDVQANDISITNIDEYIATGPSNIQ